MTRVASIVLWLGLALTASGCGLGGLVGGLLLGMSDDSSSSSAPPPLVDTATPSSGSHAGGTRITIKGSQFSVQGNTIPQVSVGGVAATEVVLVDGETLTAVVPPSASVGPAAVAVTNPTGGTATLASGFTYTNALPAASFKPVSSPQSQNVVFSFTLTDPESDLLDVRLECSLNGGGWQAIPAEQIKSGGTTSLTSSPAGVTHNLTWDSRGNAGLVTDDAEVRLRVTPIDRTDGKAGAPGESAVFDVVNNTPVDATLVQPGVDAFDVVFSYAVADPDSDDPVQVTSLTWRDVNTNATGSLTLKSGQATGTVAFSTQGVLSDSVWDSLTDLGFGNNHLVELTVTVSDGTFTRTRTTQPFFVHNGPLSQPVSADTLIQSGGYAFGDVSSPTRILRHGVVTGGPFLVGETLTGGTSGRTAKVDRLGEGYLLVVNEDGALVPGETVTGGSSGASATLSSLSHYPPFPDVVACARQNNAPGRVSVARCTGQGFDSPVVVTVPNIAGLPIPGSSTNRFLSGYAQPSECALLDVDGDGLQDLVAASHDGLTSISTLISQAGADAGTGFANVRAHQVIFTATQAGGALQVAAGTYSSMQAARTAVAPHVRVAGQAASTWPPAASGNPSLDNIGWFGGAVVAADVSAPGTASAGHDDVVVLHRIRQLGSAFGSDLGGAVVVRQYDPTSKTLEAPVYLDPTDMGSLPTHLAVADLTSDAHTTANGGLPGDGRDVPAGTPDIVVANLGDSSLTFYLQVSPATSPATWVSCKLSLPALVSGMPAGDVNGVAIGDLNGDGFNDFAVVGQITKRVYLFVHDRNAAASGSLLGVASTAGLLPFRFAGALTLPAPNGRRPVIADLSGDGKLDIAVPLFLNNEVVLFVNHGTIAGTPVFGPAPTYSAQAVRFPTSFAPTDSGVADFNADGNLDLGVATANQTASVYFRATPGTLDPASLIATGNVPVYLAHGDLSGDGAPELAVSLQGDNTVQRFVRGSPLALDQTVDLGTYADPSPATLVTSAPQSVKLADLSGDGNADHLLTSQFVVAGSGLNVGGWTRTPLGSATVAAVRTTAQTMSFPACLDVSAGDFLYQGGVPDGIPDVAAGTADGLQLFRGEGAFSYGIPQVLSPGQVISNVEVVDLDGDGRLDVVCAVNGKGVAVYYNGGHPAGSIAYGSLPSSPEFIDLQGIPSASYFAVADLGGTSAQDIAFANFNGAGGGVLFQTGARAFTAVHLAAGGEPGMVAAADLNGDGHLDLAIPWGKDNLLAVYYADPSAAGLSDRFRAPALFPTSQNPIGVTVFDVDGDGRQDAVVSCRGANVLNVFRQR